jgi:hypothetical protein
VCERMCGVALVRRQQLARHQMTLMCALLAGRTQCMRHVRCRCCVNRDFASAAAAPTLIPLLMLRLPLFQLCGWNDALLEGTKYRRILFAIIPPAVTNYVSAPKKNFFLFFLFCRSSLTLCTMIGDPVSCLSVAFAWACGLSVCADIHRAAVACTQCTGRRRRRRT